MAHLGHAGSVIPAHKLPRGEPAPPLHAQRRLECFPFTPPASSRPVNPALCAPTVTFDNGIGRPPGAPASPRGLAGGGTERGQAQPRTQAVGREGPPALWHRDPTLCVRAGARLHAGRESAHWPGSPGAQGPQTRPAPRGADTPVRQTARAPRGQGMALPRPPRWRVPRYQGALPPSLPSR